MQVHRPTEAGAFLTLAGPLMQRDEARNQLALGIAGTVLEKPDAYETARFWVVMDGSEPAAAALRTSPYDLVLADPLSETALARLLDAAAKDDPEVPGIVGNVPYIGDAARVSRPRPTGGTSGPSRKASTRSSRSEGSRKHPVNLAQRVPATATSFGTG